MLQQDTTPRRISDLATGAGERAPLLSSCAWSWAGCIDWAAVRPGETGTAPSSVPQVCASTG